MRYVTTVMDGSQSQGRYLHRTAQTQISMHQVGFEPTIPMYERAKTLYRAATVIGSLWYYPGKQ
jgi:hypothetical protein